MITIKLNLNLQNGELRLDRISGHHIESIRGETLRLHIVSKRKLCRICWHRKTVYRFSKKYYPFDNSTLGWIWIGKRHPNESYVCLKCMNEKQKQKIRLYLEQSTYH